MSNKEIQPEMGISEVSEPPKTHTHILIKNDLIFLVTLDPGWRGLPMFGETDCGLMYYMGTRSTYKVEGYGDGFVMKMKDYLRKKK